MNDNPQLIRYKKLIRFIDDHLNEDLNIEKVEEICHYSYRNINRIFEAIHQETIGKYVKRLRLEKAAQYLKYSDMGISQIGYQVGFEDRTAFSKAFKKRYDMAPQDYRDQTERDLEGLQKKTISLESGQRKPLQYAIEFLPEFNYLFLEYRGDYGDNNAVESAWEKLFLHGADLDLVSENTLFMTEILDDEEISDCINSRYRFSIILEHPLEKEPNDLLHLNKHKRQKYAKFTHQGSQQSLNDYYQSLFAFWIMDVQRELVDLPILEFYPNYEENLAENQLITEIYIAIE